MAPAPGSLILRNSCVEVHWSGSVAVKAGPLAWLLGLNGKNKTCLRPPDRESHPYQVTILHLKKDAISGSEVHTVTEQVSDPELNPKRLVKGATPTRTWTH